MERLEACRGLPSATLLFHFIACVALLCAVLGNAEPTVSDGPSTEALRLHKKLDALRTSADVLMSSHEQALIESFLESSHTMLEWGSGHSTFWFSRFVKSYYSIEHNRDWHDAVVKNQTAFPNVQITLAAVDAGHKGWAYTGPIEEGTLEQFEEYVHAVDRFGVDKFDRVLIDGRARSACTEYMLPYLAPDAVVFIHDYVPRPYYHGAAEKHFTEIARISDGQSLVVLKPRVHGETE